MEKSFVCPRCGNSDPKYIGLKNGEPYCRRCIAFQGEQAKDEPIPSRPVQLSLAYSLSKEQKALSDRIVSNFVSGIDTLVYAVCGSGKTEISYAVIGYAMAKGMKVGFALPRRDVVIELYHRLVSAFPKQKVVAVYGGNSEVIEGDLIILTTHQLYRYPHYFDLLVMDEIDAFPFKGNEALIGIYKKSLRGHCVMMSATPSKEIVREFSMGDKEMLTLHTRFHKHPIPVPRAVNVIKPLQIVWMVNKLEEYRKSGKRAFVFVPTVELAESVFRQVRLFVPNGDYVSSKRPDRAKIIERFKNGETDFLITTAVLERGITVKDLQVIVMQADSAIYDAAALIQIAGRAGRKADAPDGEVIFYYERLTAGIKKAIEEIRYCNTFL
ncbi:MAG: helicase-related protein [Candidatus Enteromonas sp.]|nr:helicase-related protein [Candidatus Enteromonas sp.]MDY6094584.1 helicase-related protein [Candidatus Enteromonas sp.]